MNYARFATNVVKYCISFVGGYYYGFYFPLFMECEAFFVSEGLFMQPFLIYDCVNMFGEEKCAIIILCDILTQLEVWRNKVQCEKLQRCRTQGQACSGHVTPCRGLAVLQAHPQTKKQKWACATPAENVSEIMKQWILIEC